MRNPRALRSGTAGPVLPLMLPLALLLALLPALCAGIPPAAGGPAPTGPAPESPAPAEGSPAPTAVCVIAPRTQADGDGPARALVPLSRPTIFVREPLEALRLLRGSAVLWERRAGLEGAIEGPIAWPLPALRPGESLRLLLEPAAGGSGGSAELLIRAADPTRLRRTDSLVASLGANPDAWRREVERAVTRGDAELATALLFAFEGPSAPDLDALRREVFARSCRQDASP